MKILDFGCGDGNNKYNIYSADNSVCGIDIDQENVDHCASKFPDHQFILVDGDIIPYWDNTFDAIQSLDVLEHVDDIDRILDECSRILRIGGKFHIEVPYWASEDILISLKPDYWSQIHHVRMFRPDEMDAIMSKHGFHLIEEKKVCHFNHVILAYKFKYGTITDQKWNIAMPLWRTLLMKMIYSPYYLMYLCFSKYFDNRFPKSIYFEFEKIS